MATYRILGDDDLYVAVIDRIVPAGETFEVDDDVARELAFAPDVYETLVEPKALPKPEQPKKNGSVDEWREYALSQGADPTRVAELGRDDLIAEFGDKED